LVSDIRNRLGFPSISSSFIQLYINDEFMGFYIISDAFKKSWIEYVYGEKDTTNLYQCNGLYDFTISKIDGCINENDEITNNSELESFLIRVENAESAEDLEDTFEVDHFLRLLTI